MSAALTRREALVAGFGVAAAGVIAPRAGFGADKGPKLDAGLVAEVVGAAHRDLERVRDLVEATPALVRAAHDWGGGDFETALGAAAHTGRVEIAEYLISRGAPMDLFAAAMLGKVDVVRAVVMAMPEQVRTPGPHGIPLIAHARFEQCAAVREYLEGLGG